MILIQAASQTSTSISNPTIFAALVSATVLFFVNIVTQVVQILIHNRTYKHGINMLAEKKTEEKRKEIYKRLNEFYGPFQQYLNKSLELYRIFVLNKPQGFRTLTYLLNKEHVYDGHGPVVLSNNDKAILEEIFKIGEKLEELIVSKAGLVDDPILRNDFEPLFNGDTISDVSGLEKNGLLALFGAHLLIIRLAYNNKISGDLDTFKKYVFPRDLPVVIENNILRLNTELEKLNVVEDSVVN